MEAEHSKGHHFPIVASPINISTPVPSSLYVTQRYPYMIAQNQVSSYNPFCFLLYLKEIYAQFVETNVLVKHNIYHELKLTIMDLDLQITWKHPVDNIIQ